MTRIQIENGYYADNCEDDLNKWEIFNVNNVSLGMVSLKKKKLFNKTFLDTTKISKFLKDVQSLIDEINTFYSEGYTGC